MKIYAKNKKAYFDYEIIESYEAGIILLGPEVKGILDARIQLKGSYVQIKNNELYLISCSISKPEGNPSWVFHDELREKKLLMHKKEIQKLNVKVQEKGFTLIVTEVYKDTSKKIKVKLCLVKGKALYDKKSVIKERQLDIETKRILKDY